ncbi:MAG TPA: ABC transporter permease [Bacillus sp. (in: firmicutes)]|uniref:ABC transporter permease n=1 Tax=Bacillus litorisediminis TaxID=2922713 RepID=UPI001FAF237F|nr:ABC transporter permease [Bacillus litorisediminis]HWO77013.1 ABC transporter permease [Bacillus sp. (in: firmicutes)]
MKFLALLQVEWLKMRKTTIWLLALISPALATAIAYGLGDPHSPRPWIDSFYGMVIPHGVLFLPLLAGVYSAFVCRFEHLDGGWKQLFAFPVTRIKVVLSKFTIVMGLLFINQVLIVAGLFVVGMIKGFPAPFPWEVLLKSTMGGLAACIPLCVLQMWFSCIWSSFAAPFTIAVVFTLPNMLIANSEDFGPYYPWVQPFLAMIPEGGGFIVSTATLWSVIGISSVLFAGFATVYIKRKVF